MQNVRSGSHLELIGETWYYRRIVPRDARAAFGKAVVRISLGTKSLAEAKRLEKQYDVDFESRLREARGPRPGDYQKHRCVAEKILKENNWAGAPWDQEFAKIPQADRSGVSNEISRLLWQRGYGAVTGQSTEEVDAQDLPLRRGTESEHWAKVRAQLVELLEYYDKGSDPTIELAYEQWLKAKRRPQQTQNEARRYIEDFKKSAQLRTLTYIRRRHLTDWRDKLREAGDLAPKSINHRLGIVSAILRTGWREAEKATPADLARINVPEPVSNGRKSWSRAELLGALAALEPRSWSAWVFVVALTTGTRIGEPIAAVKDWYDFATGCIKVPAEFTKMKKEHALPIIELIREPLVEHISILPAGAYMFNAPRPANTKLKISHEASKWYSRFFDRHKIIDRVFHELRDTWIDAARKSTAKRDLWEIISGHSPRTGSDPY